MEHNQFAITLFYDKNFLVFLFFIRFEGQFFNFFFIYFRAQKSGTTPEEKEQIAEIEKNVMKRKAQLYEIEQSLPQKNSLYLQVRFFFAL